MVSRKSQIYGQALFECESSKELFSQLEVLSDIFTQQEVLDFFLSFTVPKEDKKRLLDLSLKHSRPLLKNFFCILLDNRAFSLLPQIVESYQKLMDEKNNICRGTVFSPYPVSKDQKRELENILQKFFNKRIELRQKENKKLVGGLFIDVGGYVFDSTVKYQLERFKTSGGEYVFVPSR